MSVWVNAGPVQSVLMPLAIPLLGLAPVTLLTDGNQKFLQWKNKRRKRF